MEIAHLEAFLEAAERGSFRRAAEALFLAQPSVSARIQRLEYELGVPLFHRMARGVRLTDMGRTFLPSTPLLPPHKPQLLAGQRTGLRIWQPAPGRKHSTGD